MKARNVAVVLALAAAPCIGLAQRTVHTEEKTATSTPPRSNSLVAERRPATAVHSNAQGARFQQVATALSLNNHQKKNVATLIESTRDQLAAIRSNSSLTPAQQQKAAQGVDLGLAQKFVGILTPAQKKELEAMLLKRKQDANANSASGSGASAPDIPTIDAPSGSDSDQGPDPSSFADSAAKDSSSASNTPAAATDSSTTSGDATATTANSTTTTSANASATSPAQPAAPKAETSSSTVTAAKHGHLSDAELAALLNSFVQDESDNSGAKPVTQAKSGSGS